MDNSGSTCKDNNKQKLYVDGLNYYSTFFGEPESNKWDFY